MLNLIHAFLFNHGVTENVKEINAALFSLNFVSGLYCLIRLHCILIPKILFFLLYAISKAPRENPRGLMIN